MAPAMNVIALISGGKDSLFSILHCQANGHNVVALANLYPPATNPGKYGYNNDDDLDSYMYQTVGHTVIPLYECALGIPLYRQEITGTAINSEKDYAAPEVSIKKKSPQDETEDLVPLLRKVMQAHPEANAVSTGAILSTYQRTRVESVAVRLGLKPLSYLWQYPLLPPYTQSSLLSDMAAVGQKAIIIKTASGGLDEEFLGLDVATQRTMTRLGKTMGSYGVPSNGAILGEGGEFETLALDGPRPLWKKRIRISNAPPSLPGGGQTLARITDSVLEEKTDETDDDATNTLRIPDLFDVEFKKILDFPDDDGQSIVSEDATLVNESIIVPEGLSGAQHFCPHHATSDNPTLFTFSNVTSDNSTFDSDTPTRQLMKIFLRVDHCLLQWHVPKSSINHCTLLLRNMADFPVLNQVYAGYFSAVNPPARVTVALGDMMPSGCDVMLSILVDKDGTGKKGKVVHKMIRQGLHVQSQSYWAPANIGPYSQAISVDLPREEGHKNVTESGEVVYVAGQIPLVPASMEVYQENGFKGQAVLSLQHLWRIGRAKNVHWWTAGVAFIPSRVNPDECVRTAQAVWKAAHDPAFSSAVYKSSEDIDNDDDEDDVDPWDQINCRNSFGAFVDITMRAPIPRHHNVLGGSFRGCATPPCFVVQVASLPRDVDIEWSATGLTSSPIHFEYSIRMPGLTMAHPNGSRSRFYTLEIRHAEDVDALKKLKELREWSAATLYASRALGTAGLKINLRGVQWFPCDRVWGEKEEVRAIFVGRVDKQDEADAKLVGDFAKKMRIGSI